MWQQRGGVWYLGPVDSTFITMFGRKTDSYVSKLVKVNPGKDIYRTDSFQTLQNGMGELRITR